MTVPAWKKKILINPDPCTPSDNRENWAAVIRLFQDIAPDFIDIQEELEKIEAGDADEVNYYDSNPFYDYVNQVSFGLSEPVIWWNSTSETVPVNAIVRIADETFTQVFTDRQFVAEYGAGSESPFGNIGTRHVYYGAKPNTEFKRRYLINWYAAVPPENAGFPFGYGLGTFATDQMQCRLDVDGGLDPVIDAEWGPKNDSWDLWRDRPGFFAYGGKVALADAGSSGIFHQKMTETVIGKIGSTVASGATGTVTVWSGASFATLASTGQDIAGATNWGPEATIGDWVNVSWPHGKPYFVHRCAD